MTTNPFNMLGNSPPKRRCDCINNTRPCPWMRCKHHMIWAESEFDLGRMTDDQLCDKLLSYPETCVLDVADRDGVTLQDVADILGISRERARQIEGDSDKKTINKGIALLRQSPPRMRWLRNILEDGY